MAVDVGHSNTRGDMIMSGMKWVNAKKEMPSKSNKLGYLLKIAECEVPMIGQYDPESKRFVVFIPTVRGSIQIPVTHWCKIEPV